MHSGGKMSTTHYYFSETNCLREFRVRKKVWEKISILFMKEHTWSPVSVWVAIHSLHSFFLKGIAPVKLLEQKQFWIMSPGVNWSSDRREKPPASDCIWNGLEIDFNENKPKGFKERMLVGWHLRRWASSSSYYRNREGNWEEKINM